VVDILDFVNLSFIFFKLSCLEHTYSRACSLGYLFVISISSLGVHPKFCFLRSHFD
jgi:hypothetical protein